MSLKQRDEEIQLKLKELMKLLHKAETERQNSEATVLNINRIHEKVKVDQKLNSHGRNKLRAFYSQALTDAEAEQDAYRQVLSEIAAIRALRTAAATQCGPTILRRGVLMSLLQEQARTLPLWAGEAGAEPPGLCGAVPAALDYIGQRGDKVAALVCEEEEENWILAELGGYNTNTARYEVDDVDAEEGKERHHLSRKRVIHLPQWKANPETNPEALFAKGTEVLALYPQTTCFYRALVDDAPQHIHDGYSLYFEDSNYPEGYAPPLKIQQRYVIALRNGASNANMSVTSRRNREESVVGNGTRRK